MKKNRSRLEKLEETAKRLPPPRSSLANGVANCGIPLSAWLAFTMDCWQAGSMPTDRPWPPSDEDLEAHIAEQTEFHRQMEIGEPLAYLAKLKPTERA